MSWPRRGSLLLRIFLVMLASTAVVQMISVALVFLLPLPTPPLFSVDQIGAALQTGRDASGELRFSNAAPDPDYVESPRAARVRRALSQRLAIPEARVRVRPMVEPRPTRPMVDMGMEPGRPPARAINMGTEPGRPPARAIDMGGDPGRPPIRTPFGRADGDFLFGDFTASMQLADGSWRSVRPVRSAIDFWRWRALYWLLAALIAVLPFAWWLARRLARPIEVFASAAERLGRDPRAPQIALEGPPEIADAAAAFNRMQSRLSRYVEDRSMMIAAIAHDLRTPLTRIALRNEKVVEPLRTANEDDIRDMEAMLVSTLAMVRDLSTPPRRKRLDLCALIESVTDSFIDDGAEVTLAIDSYPIIEGDRGELKRLFSNLIRNAILYAGSAEVALGTGADAIWVEVSDHGPGIEDHLLERVFDPFFRVEKSRNRETGGTGLGLSSARAIAQANGGEVTLRNRPTGGLIARVAFPIDSSTNVQALRPATPGPNVPDL